MNWTGPTVNCFHREDEFLQFGFAWNENIFSFCYGKLQLKVNISFESKQNFLHAVLTCALWIQCVAKCWILIWQMWVWVLSAMLKQKLGFMWRQVFLILLTVSFWSLWVEPVRSIFQTNRAFCGISVKLDMVVPYVTVTNPKMPLHGAFFSKFTGGCEAASLIRKQLSHFYTLHKGWGGLKKK